VKLVFLYVHHSRAEHEQAEGRTNRQQFRNGSIYYILRKSGLLKYGIDEDMLNREANQGDKRKLIDSRRDEAYDQLTSQLIDSDRLLEKQHKAFLEL